VPYQSGRSPQPAIPRSVATRNLLLRKKIGSRHLSCSKLWSAVRMRDLRLSLRIRHKLSPKGMHKVAVGNAHGPCPRARADPERVAHRACTATHATLSGLGWERLYTWSSGVARRYVLRSFQGHTTLPCATLASFPFIYTCEKQPANVIMASKPFFRVALQKVHASC